MSSRAAYRRQVKEKSQCQVCKTLDLRYATTNRPMDICIDCFQSSVNRRIFYKMRSSIPKKQWDTYGQLDA